MHNECNSITSRNQTKKQQLDSESNHATAGLTKNEKISQISCTGGIDNSARLPQDEYSEPLKVKESSDPNSLESETAVEGCSSNSSTKVVSEVEETQRIPSKLTISEPINTVYQFPEPNGENVSSPIDGIFSSEKHKQFEDTAVGNSVQASSNAKVPTRTLINASEVVSNRPRSSLLFTRRLRHKKMDRGLETINRLILSVVGQSRGNCVIKSTPITEDYTIGSNVLGLGINGKVVECIRKVKPNDNEPSADKPKKCALKVLKDNAKSRREIDLHWKASNCKHIVNIIDVYENTYSGNKCLLVVMEW